MKLKEESVDSLNSKKLDLLIDDSKDLLIAFGYTEYEVETMIKHNKEIVVKMALDIYIKNNKQIIK